MSSDPSFDAFVQCMKVQGNLDLEAWDVMLWEPLKDLAAWWQKQSDPTKLFSGWLVGVGSSALARWIGRAAGIAAAEVAGTLAEAIIAVLAGLALGTFMDMVVRCIAQQVPSV